MKKWTLLYDRKPQEDFINSLLVSRQIDDAQAFFSHPKLEDLHDPFLFNEMPKVVERILLAVNSKERIVIYGDYDVDGTSGSAILIHTLRLLGGEVSYRIPHRRKDGYGLHNSYISELSEKGVSLIITVDCGISCKDQVAFANEKKIDVIITDHHSIPAILPPAFAILHPALAELYPFKSLSGSAMAFKLASALLIKTENSDFIPALLDLASLGTVADCVPLYGENRNIVKLGLAQMTNTRWEGLRAILKSAGLWGLQEFTSETIAYQIGPRINASGRMDSPYWALQALLAEDLDAMEKALYLENLNRNRQDLMRNIMETIGSRVDTSSSILIDYDKEWPSGIVGLIAGRLQEQYGKPSLIMEDRGDVLVGSARSLPGFNCVSAIASASHLLQGYGGHEQAAGFSLKKENLQNFIDSMHEYANEKFKDQKIEPELKIDLSLMPEDLNSENIILINKFAPFGIGNEVPCFLMEGVKILNPKPVGSKGDHLKFSFEFGKNIFDGIAFNFSQDLEAFKGANALVGELSLNEWNGTAKAQIKLKDFKGES